MTVSASTQIPKTGDPAVFQRQCKVLFEHILKDPGVKEFGSSGQAQQGIDLLGRRKDRGLNHWVGIQCKLTIKAEKLDTSKLRKDALAALQIKPPLKEFILVTTAPDDVTLDKEARAITAAQAQLGRDFLVQVWGWGTLETNILQYEDVIRAFAPDAFPHVQRLLEGQERLSELIDSNNEAILATLGKIAAHIEVPNSPVPASTYESSSLNTLLDRQVNEVRNFINEGNSSIAARMLQAMWDQLPSDASDRIRFRIQANIAACKFRLGENEEAGKRYLQAYEYAPEEPKAAAFKVLGLILLDRAKEAYEFGITALRDAPEKAILVSHIVIAAKFLPEIEDPSSLIPMDVESDDSVAVAKIDFLRTRGEPDWRTAAIAAYADHPENPNITRFAAEAAIEEACEWLNENRCFMFPPELEGRVRQASEVLLKQFVDSLGRPDTQVRFDAAICVNLTTAYRLLRDLQSAKDAVSKGLEIAPDDADLREVWAKITLERGDATEAEQALNYLREIRDRVIGKLQVFANQGKWADIIQLSDSVDFLEFAPADQAFAKSIALLARSCLDENFDARPDAEALLVEYPNEPTVPIVLYEIAARRGEDEWSSTLYQTAKKKTELLSLPARLMLARIAEREKDPETVTDLLFGYIALDRDSEELRLLSRAFVNGPPRQAAADFAAALPANLRRSPFFSRVIGSIHFNRGALPDAEWAFHAAIEANPFDLNAHLGLINTFLRLDRKPDIEEHLRGIDHTRLEGAAHLKISFAQILVQFGRPDDGLAYGYQVALENRNDSRVSLYYIGLILPNPSGLLVPRVGDSVTVDCAVEVERSDGKRLRLTIEDGPDRPAIDHYSPEHNFAKMVLGARAGDAVTLNSRGGTPQSWRVLSFKHKYLALFHDIIDTFPARFPDAQGFYVVETQGNDLAPVLEQIKSVSLRNAELFNRYATEPFPLGMVAALLGQTTIETARQLVLRGYVIKTCIGTQFERELARSVIAKGRANGVVLDVYTAWCVHALGHFGTIRSLFPRIVLPRSTLDEIRSWRKRYEEHGGEPMLTVGYADGQFFRQEISAEQLNESRLAIEEVIRTLEAECEVLPATAPGSPSRLESMVVEVSRLGVLDAAHIAFSQDLLLLSEDLHYRNLAKELYQADGAWLQVLLMEALDAKVIDFERYACSVADLAILKHDYITVSEPVLTSIATTDDADGMPRFAAALDFIGTPKADIASHLKVSWDLLLRIWNNKKLSDLRKRKACGMMLSRLEPMFARNGNFAEVLHQMIEQSRHTPVLQRYIQDWARGHFIAPGPSNCGDKCADEKRDKRRRK